MLQFPSKILMLDLPKNKPHYIKESLYLSLSQEVLTTFLGYKSKVPLYITTIPCNQLDYHSLITICKHFFDLSVLGLKYQFINSPQFKLNKILFVSKNKMTIYYNWKKYLWLKKQNYVSATITKADNWSGTTP